MHGIALHRMIYHGILWHCMVLYGIALISDWSIGFGARAVSHNTPIYFIIFKGEKKSFHSGCGKTTWTSN